MSPILRPTLVSHTGIAAVAALFLSVVSAGLIWLFAPAINARSRPSKEASYRFRRFRPKGPELQTDADEEVFPTLDRPPEVVLSLVIPAYDEEKRLPVMLDSALAFLKEWSSRKNGLTYELVVVDDGSKDGTADLVLGYSKRLGSNEIRLLKLPKNRGKGGALREGMLHIRGQYGLMVDADGATDITCLERLYDSTKKIEVDTDNGRVAVGIGSRAHMEQDAIAQRAWYRTLLMKGLHLLVRALISGKIQDTQCGFKLFSRSAVRILFGSLHLERWGFDLEIIHLCDRLGLPMVEVPVRWHEVEGSKLIQRKLDVVLASANIFRDMLCVRLCYLLGIWSAAHARVEIKECKADKSD